MSDLTRCNSDGGIDGHCGCKVPCFKPDLTRYRMEPSNASDHDHVCNDVTGCYRLVPDDTLQRIKDAPRCEHGNIYPHEGLETFEASDGFAAMRTYECEGAPELRALLDGLGGTDDE